MRPKKIKIGSGVYSFCDALDFDEFWIFEKGQN